MMKIKIKLVNICIRHKCPNYLANCRSYHPPEQGQSSSNKKVVRIRKISKITSKSHSSVKTKDNETFHTKNELLHHKLNDSILYNHANIQSPSVDSQTIYFHENISDESIWKSEQVPEKNENNETRYNELNMQMLSKKLHQQVFGENPKSTADTPRKVIESLKRELDAFDIKVDDTSYMPDVDIDLPPLEGKDLMEHFLNISQTQTAPYLKIVDEILQDIPSMPKKWIFQEGWTRYVKAKR